MQTEQQNTGPENQIAPINGSYNYEGIWFENFENNLASSLFLDCKIAIDSQNYVKFDNDRNIFDLEMGTYIYEYQSKERRDADLALFNELSHFKSFELQSPEVLSRFEYNDEDDTKKYCLVVEALKMKGETNEYALKGLIVNPELAKKTIEATSSIQNNTHDGVESVKKL